MDEMAFPPPPRVAAALDLCLSLLRDEALRLERLNPEPGSAEAEKRPDVHFHRSIPALMVLQ
jgi:hypothetical protein